jgi:FkbM family methyltransferase
MSELRYPVKDMPWYFQSARNFGRKGWFGVYRAMRLMRALGLFNVVARFSLRNGATMHVPLYRLDSWWDEQDVWTYSSEMIDAIGQGIEQLSGPVLLIDCGADIGAVSVLLVSRNPKIREVVAFEPNPVAHAVLRLNLTAMSCAARAEEAGVGAVAGRGSLQSPQHDMSDHARFVVSGAEGDFPIVRIDDFKIADGRDLVLKIDVEGGEQDVLQGAKRVLERARDFIIAFEAHPVQTERTGVDPVEMIRLIDGIRPCAISVAEFPDIKVSTDRPFFDQVKTRRPCNIICSTRGR